MSYWKLILAYDGTPFHGWQIQPGLPTVQGLLADAIHRTVGERVLPQGSGRTDTGVHALGQVASFTLAAPIPAANLQNALNRCLPPSIRILTAEIVPPEFHARHAALRKTYEYRIFPLKPTTITPITNPGAPGLASETWASREGATVLPHPATKTRVPHSSQSHRDPETPASGLGSLGWDVSLPSGPAHICSPILAPFVWPCPWPLSLDALNQAATHVLGTHDFTSFAASDPDLTTRNTTPGHVPNHATNIRTITQSDWHTADGLFIYRVSATGFLHHMVRNLVGTFVQCGAHRLNPDSIPTLLAARNRSAAGPTAPPTGLFLVNVEYSTDNPQPATSNSL